MMRLNSYHDDEQKRLIGKLLRANAPRLERVILFDSLLREQSAARKEMRMARKAMGSRRRRNVSMKLKEMEAIVKREMKVWPEA